MHNLREAKRAVASPEALVVIDRLIEQVTPLYHAARAVSSGPAWTPGDTLSGISIDELLGRTSPPPEGETAASTETERDAPPSPSTSGSGGGSGPDSADAMTALIEAGRTGEALAICQRLAPRPGPRSLSRFLYQYGRCLEAEDRPRDAALMYMRCAILYDQSAWAAPSLIATAEIYRREFKTPATARRLLTRAIEFATSRDQQEHVEAAQTLLDALEEPSS
jgi:hypothetical protein